MDATAISQVRLLIGDQDPARQLLSSEQVTGYLQLNGAPDEGAVPTGTIRLAAADALDAIASSEALTSKKIRTQDLQTDGPAVAAELRARAASLRDLAWFSDDAGVVEYVAQPATRWYW